VAGVILHCPQLSCSSERVRHAFGGALVVGRERYSHMTIVEDGVVRPIGLFDLIERLGNEKALEAVAGHEGERGLEEIKPSKRRKLIEHEQEPMPTSSGLEILGETTPDLVEDQSHQGLGPTDVRRRHNEIERRRPFVLNEIADAPVAAARYLRNDGVAVETEERHRGR